MLIILVACQFDEFVVVVAVDVRLNSLQYTSLCDRLMSPIRTARDVVIHQSLGDRFAAAFAEQVHRNGVYRLPLNGPVSSMVV